MGLRNVWLFYRKNLPSVTCRSQKVFVATKWSCIVRIAKQMAMIQNGNKFNIELFTDSRHVNSPSAARSLLVSIDFIQVSQAVTFFFRYYMPSPSKKSLIRKLIHLLVFFKKYYFAILNCSYYGKYHETWQNWKIFNLASLRKKCPCSELFWYVFSRIRIKYGEIWSISPYSVLMRENGDQNNSKYGRFSSKDHCI